MREVAHAASETSAGVWSFPMKERVRDYLQLAKARLSSMVLLSALVGYWLASTEIALAHLLWFAIGTFLVVAGANALNDVFDLDIERLGQ